MSILVNKYALMPAAMLAAITIVAGCGEETQENIPAVVDAAPAEEVPMSSYGGPGSNWAYDLFDDGSFEVTRSDALGLADDLNIGGSYEVTATGFLQMTVDSSSGADAPVAGETFWAIELPNGTAILSPTSASSGQMVPIVQAGACVDGDIEGPSSSRCRFRCHRTHRRPLGRGHGC